MGARIADGSNAATFNRATNDFRQAFGTFMRLTRTAFKYSDYQRYLRAHAQLLSAALAHEEKMRGMLK